MSAAIDGVRNIYAERALIFYTWMDDCLLDQFVPDDFYDDTHKELWRQMTEAKATHGELRDGIVKSFGPQTAIQIMNCHLEWDEEKLYGLGTVTAAAEAVRECSRRRALAIKLNEIKGMAINSAVTTETIAKELAAVDIPSTDPVSSDHSMRGVMERTLKVLQGRSSGEVKTVPIGIPDLDEKTGGLYPAEMTVIGARPGTGKTALALHIACTAAQAGKRVVFLSREMSDVQIGERILARRGVSMARSRRGTLLPKEWTAAQEAMFDEWMGNIIVDAASTTVSGLRAQCKRAASAGGLDLVVIDYLQLVRPEDDNGSRNDQIAKISWSIKDLARTLNVAVVVLSQLNRETKTRTDSRPQLTDLRDSGAIEQDADSVWLLHAPKQSDDPQIQTLIDFTQGEPRTLIMVDIAKARQSTTGEVYVMFQKSLMTFTTIRPQNP